MKNPYAEIRKVPLNYEGIKSSAYSVQYEESLGSWKEVGVVSNKYMLLPRKPEIVVIDHMGLLRSQKSDNNMKVEEASQALMELAVKNNIIVFAVSEITKSAFAEGMNIASAKGAFRVAYNANKVLSITPFKEKETNLIRSLRVESTANREKEHLDVNLPVQGAKIG